MVVLYAEVECLSNQIAKWTRMSEPARTDEDDMADPEHQKAAVDTLTQPLSAAVQDI